MNKFILLIIDLIIYLTMWIFIWDKVKFSEVKKRRYNNDSGYFEKINNWDAAVFLHERAQSRVDLLQTKLTSLLSILSILVGLFSITGAFTKNFPVYVQIACLVLSLLGLIYAIGPLTISTVYVADLDKLINTNDFNPEVEKEFQLAITDMGCRSDFHADCLKIAKSIIFISVTFYICGIFIGLAHSSNLSSTLTSQEINQHNSTRLQIDSIKQTKVDSTKAK